MPHLEDHPAGCRCIQQFNAVSDASKPHALYGGSLRFVETYRATQQGVLTVGPLVFVGAFLRHVLYCLLRGGERSSPVFSSPPNRRTIRGSLSPISPANVARTTLWEFAEP